MARTEIEKGQAVESILAAIAEAQDKGLTDLRAELSQAGPDMPLDSLDVVEVMLGLEDEFGIRFPDSSETCDAFQSVSRLAEFVQRLVHEGGGKEANDG